MMIDEGDRRSGSRRFRVNATSCLFDKSYGYTVTMRAIPDVIPDLDDLGVDSELRSHLFPDNGLVCISGKMGSGKTTTIAGVMKEIRLKTRRSLMTVEKPIEFDYTKIEGALGPIEQIEVPTMMTTFHEAVVSSTRKAVDVILLGEANDRPTMEATIHVAEIGLAVYMTLHTKSVSVIPSRIIHQFSAEDAPGISVSFLTSARLLIQQRLLPRVGVGRVAIREWLSIDDDIRQELIDTPTEKLSPVMERIVKTKGHPLIEEARIAYRAGLISKETLHNIEVEKK